MCFKGCGGGLVVSMLAFYSDDPSSIPAEVYNFSVKLLLKRTKINKKRPGLAQFLKIKKINVLYFREEELFYFEICLCHCLQITEVLVAAFLYGPSSMTRLGDFLHIGLLLKGFGNN